MEKELQGRTTPESQQLLTVLYVVLLFVFSGVGCRDSKTGPTEPQPLPFTLSFAAGDEFVYDTWVLDQRYPQLPLTKTRTSWRVLRTGAEYNGVTGVTVILDSAGTASRDTLYVAASPAGDISIHGFLSRIVKRRTGHDIAPRWDRVASFGVGLTGIWTVGVTDSAGEEVVYGSVVGGSGLFSANVNGVTEVFPIYRVDLTGPTLYYSLWFANVPNAIVRLLEEPDVRINGLLREVVTIRTTPREKRLPQIRKYGSQIYTDVG